jgi:hypothetical protein
VIPPERLDQLALIVQRAGLNEQTLSVLRETFADMHLTYCMDEDVGVTEPVRSEPGFNLYLVDGRGHCMQLTTDHESATGVVLAEVEPDREVRITVADRLPAESLGLMREDPDPDVRLRVAERIAAGEAVAMMNDADWRVRFRLAGRLPLGMIEPLARDENADVREVAERRLAATRADAYDPGERQ